MSKLAEAPEAYTFDDFILEPRHSEIPSRKAPDISIDIGGLILDTPIIASPMNTITESDMMVSLHSAGAMGILHRYMSIESQVEEVRKALLHISGAGVYAAVGVNGDTHERVKALYSEGVRGFCVDVANGHNENCVRAVQWVREHYPDAKIMAGNVATYDGAFRLAQAGANSVRVGIGPGSLCSTRVVTGHGVPQLSVIEECARIKDVQSMGKDPDALYPTRRKAFPDVAIIADGGIRNSGDIVKALAIGADAVMVGSLLSGTEETPGEWLEADGRLYKYFNGMASNEARSQWSGQSTGVPEEGISTKVLYTGKWASKVVSGLAGAVKTGMTFSDSLNIDQLRERATWRRVTLAGYTEGTPHRKREL